MIGRLEAVVLLGMRSLSMWIANYALGGFVKRREEALSYYLPYT
jgi:hypothetical protein